MSAKPNRDPAIRGRDYSIDFRRLNEAELAERHRARAEDRAIAESTPTGRAFEINRDYDEAERIRRGDGLTWFDSVTFSAGALLFLVTPLILAAGILIVFRFWLSILR